MKFKFSFGLIYLLSLTLFFLFIHFCPGYLKTIKQVMVESIAQQHRGRFVVDKHAVLAIKPITFCLWNRLTNQWAPLLPQSSSAILSFSPSVLLLGSMLSTHFAPNRTHCCEQVRLWSVCQLPWSKSVTLRSGPSVRYDENSKHATKTVCLTSSAWLGCFSSSQSQQSTCF